MHRLKDMIAMLMCDDVQESIRFYTEVLDFTVTDRMDEVGKSGWASLNHGSIQLMLASPDYIAEPVKNQGRYSQSMYYFYPEDVQALHAAVTDAGYETTELTDRFYGMREFEMLDPSGHVLVFGQVIPGDDH
ncbi:MAG: VOC family protein [Aureliella sp.]